MSSAPSVLSLVFRGISRGGLDATLPRPRARKSAPRAGENLCEKIRKEPREKWCEKLGGKKRRPPLERGAPFFFNSVGAPFFNPQRGPFFNSRGGVFFNSRRGRWSTRGGGRNALPLKRARRGRAKPLIKMQKQKKECKNQPFFTLLPRLPEKLSGSS